MAKKKSKKSNDKLLFWVFTALFALIIISIIIILVLNQNNPNTNSNFFVSDNGKYVVTSESNYNKAADSPIASYDIYYHSGDTITNHEAYYEFTDEEAAKSALPYYESLQDDDIASVKQDGKYIILTADKAQYSNLTLNDVKQ